MKTSVHHVLYNLLFLLPDKEKLKIIIEQSMTRFLTLERYNSLITYDIKMSMSDYANLFYNYFYNDKIIAIEVIEILVEWWQDVFGSDCYDNLQNECLELFWFGSLLSGNLDFYYRFIKEHSILKGAQEGQHKILENCDNKDSELQDKVIKIIGNLKEQNNHLLNENKLLRGIISLSGKSIMIAGVEPNSYNIDVFKEKYKLKRFDCFSAIRNLNTFKRRKYDYIIFSTQSAKHSILEKLKKIYKERVYLTDKTNLELVFDDFIDRIDNKKYYQY